MHAAQVQEFEVLAGALTPGRGKVMELPIMLELIPEPAAYLLRDLAIG